MGTTRIAGQLEIDHNRGVIYFHGIEEGYTTLRICGLGKIPRPHRKDIYQLDYTLPKGTVGGLMSRGVAIPKAGLKKGA